MAGGKHGGYLGSAYSATDVRTTAEVYDQWASTYDRDMAAAGYRHPAVALALLARHLPAGSSPILDAGAGTGLLGEVLRIAGYPVVVGVDISPGMLAVAEAGGAYDRLLVADLTARLPFADDSFAGIVSTGVFTTGHVGVSGLAELVRVCRRGGVIVLTVKEPLWLTELARHLSGLEARGSVAVVERTPPYVSLPGEEDALPGLGVVLRVL